MVKKMSKKQAKDLKERNTKINLILYFIMFLFVVVGMRLVYLQVLISNELRQKAQMDLAKQLVVKGERGIIFDTNGEKLATNIDVANITASPFVIKKSKVNSISSKLASILNIEKKVIFKKLSKKTRFVKIADKVSGIEAEKIRKLHMPGIYIDDDFKRQYPNGKLASAVLGFTNKENLGLEGIESKLDGLLKGRTLKIKVKKDGKGYVLNTDKVRKAKLDGSSIVLAIDSQIQSICERHLEDAVQKNRAKSGIVVAMQPFTGDLLAIAHYPNFDPNNFNKYNKSVFRNRSVTDAFEPGSAMKVFTAAIALEKGFTSESEFFCENGKYKPGKHMIHDTHPYGMLTIQEIIKFSSNIGTAKIAEALGNQTIYEYFKSFGFGSKTNIKFAGETRGIFPNAKRWSKHEGRTISFGHGIASSAIQLTTAVSAIANGGNLMTPILVKKIMARKGNIERVYEPKIRKRVISSKTANKIKTIMSLVVDGGTGIKAAIDGYSVCGKTGTAQKTLKNQKGYSKDKYLSLFAGFAPFNNPKLTILVIIDEPKGQYYASEVAAPVFKNIMSESFSYLDIPPEKQREKVLAFVSQDKNK